MFKALDEVVALSEKLFNSVSYAIETMTFTSVEENKRTTVKAMDDNIEFLTGSILIKTAPAIYSMELLVPQVFLENISRDIIVPGTVSEETSSMVIDIVLELLNTIAGSLMRNMEMLAGPFILDIPEFEIGKPLNKKAFINKNYVVDGNNTITVAITKI